MRSFLARSYALLLCAAGLFAVISPARAQETWDQSDTALANHYIQNLQQAPEYGKILDLLWTHYEKHEQTRLLLQYFEDASKPDDAPLVAKLIFGHLLRKKGNAEKALEAYQSVYEKEPKNLYVLTALAEVLRQENKLEEAAKQYAELLTLLGPGHEKWVEYQLIQADLLRELERPDEAAKIWEAVLAARPQDLALRQQIVALLLEEGRTKEAIESYKVLVTDADAERRMLAMKELGRLYEFIDDFENAAKIYHDALATVHYKHFLYDEFLGQMIRLHERFGKVADLETGWRKEGEAKNPTEQSLVRLVKFYGLTANPDEEEIWLKKLVERVPASTTHREQLAQLLIDNDKYQEAAKTLEALAKMVDKPPFSMVLLQSRVILSLNGSEEAERFLGNYLDRNTLTRESLLRVLQFAQSAFLDKTAERLLKQQQANGWGEEGEVVELKLAQFHHERGRLENVKSVIAAYVKAAANPRDQGQRLLQAAQTYQDLRMIEEARAAVREAIALGQAGRGHYLILAETHVDRHEVEEAVAQFEKVWELSGSVKERLEIDQRIFSVLRATSPAGEQGIERPTDLRQALPPTAANAAGVRPRAELGAYYARLKKAVEQDPSPPNRFRLGWWAIQIQDPGEAYKQLPQLHNPANPNLDYEELILELAEQTGNNQLILRQLELISRLQPSREEEFLIRKALMRLEVGYEDEAIRTLRTLISRPDASLKAVQALAKAYKDQGRLQALEELWSEAFARANALDKRLIVKPYVATLVELKRVDEALRIQESMIERETDLAQRRKLFEDELAIASQHNLVESSMQGEFEKMARRYPMDRFFPEALARIYQATGNADEAFQAMKRAYYMSNGDSELLGLLGEMASKTSDLKSAIYYQRKLISTSEDTTTPEEWLALIDRLEQDLRVQEADLTRKRLESKFGQDPDFLLQLANHYLGAGQVTSARRVFERIATLRPWDGETLLEVGLLSRELGDAKRAREAFEAVLEQTQQAAPNVAAKIRRIPFVSARALRPVPGKAVQLGLEDYALGIEKYVQLENASRDRLMDWMRQAKPEFQRRPADPTSLRLRAIEELARLHKSDANWLKQWQDPQSASVEERLWALFHLGAMKEAQALLDAEVATLATKEADPWALLYALITLQTGQTESLRAWVNGQENNRNYLLLALHLAQRDRTLKIDTATMDGALSLLNLTADRAGRLMDSVNDGSNPLASLLIGESIARTQGIDDYLFYLGLATMSMQLGQEDRAVHWLEESLERLNLQSGRNFSVLYLLMKPLLELQPAAEDQQRLIDVVRAEMECIPASKEVDRMAAEMWLALTLGQTEVAQGWLRKLTAFSLQKGTTPETWDSFGRLLDYMSNRAPSRNEVETIGRQFLDTEFIPPMEESALLQFQEFKKTRLLWKLETAQGGERRRLVEEYEATVNGPEQHLDLASSLESFGFAAEALPVYRELVELSPNNFPVVRGYLGACRQTQSYAEAIALMEGYLAGQKPRPDSMMDDFMHRNYSNLLYLDGQVDKLVESAKLKGVEAWNEQESERAFRRYYQLALIVLYEDRGNREAAVQVYQQMRREGSFRPDDLLRLADYYIEKKDLEAALSMLEPVEFKGKDPGEIQVLLRLAQLYSSDPTKSPVKLAEVARRSLAYEHVYTAVLDLSRYLTQTGLGDLADAILTLKARAADDPEIRFQFLMERARLRIAPGGEDLDAAELGDLLLAWPGSETSGQALLELVSSTAGTVGAAWRDAIATSRAAPAAILLSQLVEFSLSKSPDAKKLENFAAGLNGTTPEMRLAADYFLRAGSPKSALRVLTTLHRREDRNRLDDAELALEVFQALDDSASVQEWNTLTRHYNGSSSRIAQIADAFAQIGQPKLATGIYDRHFQSLKRLKVDHQYFLNHYSEFLIEQKQFVTAERLLMNMFNKSIGADPNQLVDLYGAWKKLDRLPAELRKFNLSDTVKTKVIRGGEAYPNHRAPKPESTPALSGAPVSF